MEEYEDKQEATESEQDKVSRWKKELSAASKAEEKWRKKAIDAEKLFAEQKKDETAFNVLWSNTEILIPAVYNQAPIPDIRRTPLARSGQSKALADAAADALEEALKSSIDNGDFDEAAEATTTDYTLPGRGVMRVRYEPLIVKQRMEAAEGEEPAEEDILADAKVRFEQWPWRDYRRGPGKKWQQVPWMAYRHYMTKEEVKDNFPNFADYEILQYTKSAEAEEQSSDDDNDGIYKRAEVWEIWCKESRTVKWISVGYDKFLRVDDDPLGLVGFFDTPGALQFTNRTDSLVPVVPYTYYKKQAKSLNDISARIDALVSGLKLRGIYDETMEAVSRLLIADDNEMLPAGNAITALENGGLDKAVWFLPIDHIARILTQLYAAREQTKQAIYELTGLSDILRGATDPNETLGAQQLKAQTGSKRLQRTQKKVQRYIRDVLRIAAEIIGEQFTPEILSNLTGKPVTPEVMRVLRDDRSRFFLVDIETDSTIAPDEQAEQQKVTEMLTGMSQYLGAIGPAVQAGGVSMQEARGLLGIILRRFKLGKEVEAALENSAQQQPPGALQQGGQEQQAAQLDAAKEQAKLAQEEKIAQEELAMKERVSMAEIAMKERVEMAKLAQSQQEVAVRLNMEERNNEREFSARTQRATEEE